MGYRMCRCAEGCMIKVMIKKMLLKSWWMSLLSRMGYRVQGHNSVSLIIYLQYYYDLVEGSAASLRVHMCSCVAV